MSIRHGLLALLERSPMYGYQLRHEFERSTGTTWPLNIGQVYTTLARLERDGMVEQTGESDEDGKVVYRLTDAGHAELTGWFATPIAGSDRPRDELAIKVALAVTTPGVDVRAVLQTQRTATLRHLQELTRLKAMADDTDDTVWLLVLDSMVFRAEAEVRWLDHSETRLARLAPRPASSAPSHPLPRDVAGPVSVDDESVSR
ncbi:PadR family transcriptional regulator [Jiangella gansuensis]|uniref:PadR family transcriptional regulator n=1 Tax=Jiangella gansuensis TaxID=281473 RepID=UPI0006845B84|nr:PadR family transcriptional regulator [Jiangella gansuensis]